MNTREATNYKSWIKEIVLNDSGFIGMTLSRFSKSRGSLKDKIRIRTIQLNNQK